MDLKERNVLILSFLVLCLCFAAFKFGGTGVISITGAAPDEATCIDSDGGEDYYTKGQIDYTNSPEGLGTGWDICSTDDILAEMVCVDPADSSKNFIHYTCPEGCSGGICVGEPVQKPDLIVRNLVFNKRRENLALLKFDIINNWYAPVESPFPIAIYIDDEIFGYEMWRRYEPAEQTSGLISSEPTEPREFMPLEPWEVFNKVIWLRDLGWLEGEQHTITVALDRLEIEGEYVSGFPYDYDMIDEFREDNNEISITVGTKCSDSDGGNYPNIKGTVSGISIVTIESVPTVVPYTHSDECFNNALKEYYCLNTQNIQGFTYSSEDYICENGCQDGACLECSLTDAYWSDDDVDEGDYVDLVVVSDCDGSVSFIIYGEDDVETDYSVSGCVVNGGCETDWRARYDDEYDDDDDEIAELYFVASINGVSRTSGILEVSEDVGKCLSSSDPQKCNDYPTELKCRKDWCEFDDCKWDDDLSECYERGKCGNFICEPDYGENAGNCDDCLSEILDFTWICPNYGDCIDGKQTREACDCDGDDCDQASYQSIYGQSHTKNCVDVEQFPFFDNFSLIISVLMLIMYYLVRKRFYSKNLVVS